MNYLLRIENDVFWHRVKMRALKEKKTIKNVILILLVRWLKGEFKI